MNSLYHDVLTTATVQLAFILIAWSTNRNVCPDRLQPDRSSRDVVPSCFRETDRLNNQTTNAITPRSNRRPKTVTTPPSEKARRVDESVE